MTRLLLCLALLALATPALAADGAPYTTSVGSHVFTLGDPDVQLLNEQTITVRGSMRDMADHPFEFLTYIQRCKGAACKSGTGVWSAVQFGPWQTGSDASWEISYECVPSRANYFYRHGVTIIRRDHTVTSVASDAAADVLKIRCR